MTKAKDAPRTKPLNIELLKKVRDRIRDVPLSYDQRLFAASSDQSPCGTIACIAGETLIVSRATVASGIKLLRATDDKGNVWPSAARRLGLTAKEANVLFDSHYPSGRGIATVRWPTRYKAMYDAATNAEGRARAAVAYLNRIIRSGKVLE